MYHHRIFWETEEEFLQRIGPRPLNQKTTENSQTIFHSLVNQIFSAERIQLHEVEYDILTHHRDTPTMLFSLISGCLDHPLTMRTQHIFDIVAQFPIQTAQEYLSQILPSPPQPPLPPSSPFPLCNSLIPGDLVLALFQIFVRDYETAELTLASMEVPEEKKLLHRFIQGICFEVQEKHLLAAPIFQELTELESTNPLYWYHRGFVASKAHHMKEAREFLTNAQNNDADQLFYPVLQLINIDLEEFQFGAARHRLDQFQKKDPQNAWVHFEYGNLASLEDDFVEALKQFRSAVEISPFQTQIWKNIGVIYLEMGEFEDAWETLEILQELYPRRLTSWIGMAWFWRFQNNPQKAVDCLQEGLLHVHHAFELYLELAKCYRSLAGESGAFQEYRILQLGLKEHPSNFRLRMALGEYYLVYEDREEAKAVFLSLMEEDPLYSPAILKLAQSEENYAFATIESMYKQVLEREPHNFEAWLSLGEFYFNETKLINADEALKEAYALNPQNTHLNHILGILAWGFHGEPKKAEQLLQFALEQDEMNIMIAINLADLHLNEFSDYDKAIEIATKYLKKDPQNTILQQILKEATSQNK